MGKFFWIAILVLALVATGTFAWVYNFKEKPAAAPTVIEFHNVTIRFTDNVTGKEIPMPYWIIDDGSQSTLVEDTYIGTDYGLATIVANGSFSIYNRPSTGCYYTTHWQGPRVEHASVFRADIPVQPCGKIEANQVGELVLEEPVALNISTKGIVRDVAICITWSPNIITVRAENLTKIEIPDRLKSKAVKCYDVAPELDSNRTLIPLIYSQFRHLESSDYIRVTILDGDTLFYSPLPIHETSTKADLGLPDQVYDLK